MGRRNTKKVRESTMTQRQLDRLLTKKQKSDRRNDAKDWTDNVFQKLSEVVPKDDGTE